MKAQINFDGQWLSDTQIDYRTCLMKERIQKSFKAFAIFFGLAIFSVFIPVLHFFLVPVFLILSVYLSYKKMKEIYVLDLSSLSCPGCSGKYKITQLGVSDLDQQVRLDCEACRKNLTLVLKL